MNQDGKLWGSLIKTIHMYSRGRLQVCSELPKKKMLCHHHTGMK